MSLVDMGQVEETFCPVPTRDANTMGIIDELIKNAQQKTGADFLGKAIIYADPSDCVTITATAMKKAKAK